MGLMIGSRARQPSRGDLWDLGLFIFFLCTRSRLLPEKNDFDYEVMQRQIDEWLAEYWGKPTQQDKYGSYQGKHYISLKKLKALPLEIQNLIVALIDYVNFGFFKSWAEVQQQVEEFLNC